MASNAQCVKCPIDKPFTALNKAAEYNSKNNIDKKHVTPCPKNRPYTFRQKIYLAKIDVV